MEGSGGGGFARLAGGSTGFGGVSGARKNIKCCRYNFYAYENILLVCPRCHWLGWGVPAHRRR